MKAGVLGPALASALAVAFGLMVYHPLAVDAQRDAAERAAMDRVDEGFTVRRVSTSGKYPFLRQLVFDDGRPVDLSEGEGPALAAQVIDVLRGGERSIVTEGSELRLALPQGPDAARVVRAAPPGDAHIGRTAATLFAGVLLGLGIWLTLLRRFPDRRWPAVAGASAAAAGALLALFDAQARLNGGRMVETYAFAAALVPLVFAGVHGFVNRGARSPHRVAYAYIAPALVGMGALILVPFTLGVGLAFMRHDAGEFTWVGLQNFISILSSEGYGITQPLSFYFTLVVTLMWTALNVSLHAGIGLGLALILREPTLRFKGAYRVLLIVPWAVPNYITALVWKGMFNKQYGLINHVLGVFGGEPVSWFSGFWTSFAANVTTNTWLGFPFMMVVSLGALQSIPRDLYEAADVDGASKWQQLKAITLPLLRPALLPAIILGSIWTFNMFNIIYLVSAGQPNGATDILIVEAYRWAFEQDRYGYAAAYSVLIFVILLGYSLLTSRVGREAEE